MKNFQKIVLLCLLFAGNNSIAQTQGSTLLQSTQKNKAPGRLSPVPTDPALKTFLNGTWQFSENLDKPVGKQIQVPGEWVMQGFTVTTGETAIYSKSFMLPD